MYRFSCLSAPHTAALKTNNTTYFMSLCFTYKIFYVNLNKNYCSAQCDAAEQLISHLACKRKLAVHSSPLNVWPFIQQAMV